MSLLRVILSHTQLNQNKSKDKLHSPPPEVTTLRKKNKKRVHKYAHVPARVDTSPPMLNQSRNMRSLEQWAHKRRDLCRNNVHLLMCIRRINFYGGRVDTRWHFKLPPSKQYYQSRVDFLKRIQAENKKYHHLFTHAQSSIPTTAELNREWKINRRKIVDGALCKFVLFDPEGTEACVDPAFLPAPGVKRQRVYIKLGVRGGCALGKLYVELFTDLCPKTCALFMELMRGDQVGFGYVGTCFFRKVPQLYWCGGDVIHNNGFGCYMQSNRSVPIGAENYHFSHSIPGLLSMRVTVDNEVCGIFNITFKPMPQFDLKNIVFGRVIQPCATYNTIKELGDPLSTYPVIEVWGARFV